MFLEDNQSSSINAFVILKPGFLKYKDEWKKMIKNRSTNHTETRKIKFFVTEKCKHSKITF